MSGSYGRRYRQVRAQILAGKPDCYWCGTRKATTADHEPPISVVGHPHLNLVPACVTCNSGRRPYTKAGRPSRAW